MKKELAITRILLNNIIRRVENKKNNHGLSELFAYDGRRYGMKAFLD